MAQLAIELPMEEIAALCRKWKIARLEVFGSILRDDFTPESDVDLLYVFEPDARWGWDFVDCHDEFVLALGRKVDLVSRRAIETTYNWILREEVLRETHVIYGS